VATEDGDIRGDIDGKARVGGQSPGTGKPGTGQPGADTVTPSINGNTPATSSKSAAETQVLGRRDNGSHTGRKVERPSLPDPVWHETEDDFAAAVGDELRGYPVFYDITNRRVHFNATHPQFRHQVRYYTDTWAREPRQVKIATYVPAVAEHAVRHAYVEVTLGIIMQTLLEVDDGAKRADDLRPDVLRVAIRGVMNVAPLIERMIWDEAKRRNNSAVSGPAKPAVVTAPPAPTSAPTADATPKTIA
jgi:hypothetical protein